MRERALQLADSHSCFPPDLIALQGLTHSEEFMGTDCPFSLPLDVDI